MELKPLFLDMNLRKIVLVDKTSNSYHARRYLTDKYGILLNTYIMTLGQYISQLTERALNEKKLELIDREDSLYLIESIMNDEKSEFQYFKREVISLNTYTEVLATIHELKKTGISYDNYALRGRIKAEEFARIFRQYHAALTRLKMVDEADLLKLPAVPAPNSIHLVFDNVTWLPLEKSFFENLCRGDFRLIGLPKPGCIQRPSNYTYLSENVVVDNGYLINTFCDGRTPNNLRITRAYGQSNEINGIFRDILLRGLRFDQCMVLYTGGEYVDYIRNAADYYGIPVTIQEGLKLEDTKPFYLVSQLIWYAAKGFITEDIKPIFHSAVLRLEILDYKGERVADSKLYEYIRALRVHSGAVRLLNKLDSHVRDCDEISRKMIEGPSKDKYLKSIAIGKGLMHFVEDLARLEDISSGTDEWLKSLLDIMVKYASTPEDDKEEGGKDKRALEAIRNTIERYLEGPCSYRSVSAKWLYELQQRLKGSSKDLSTPEPGKLHAARFSNTMLISRPYVFVVGLDAGHFPERRSESTILSDVDRKGLSKDLVLEQRKTDSTYKLLEVLGGFKGEVNFIYSYYDTVKVKETNPSSFIQEMLGRDGIPKSEYSFLPGSIESALTPMEDLMLDPSELLHKGEDIGNKATGTVKDFISGHIFSASQIEMMAKCRRMFYYKYVLDIPEDTEEVPGHIGWLNPADRGSLLHSILERVVSETKGSEQPDLMIERICNEEFREMDKRVPCVVRHHYDIMLKTFQRAALRYGRYYLSMITSGEVLSSETEKDFIVPVEIMFLNEEEKYSRTIILRGIIDRVDINRDGTITIVDYKSGKPFEDNSANREKLQDYLYTLAAREIYRGREVKEARYEFPLEEAEGIYWAMDGAKLDALTNEKARIILAAIEDVSRGCFRRAEDSKHCTYCSFYLHCRPHINGGDESWM